MLIAVVMGACATSQSSEQTAALLSSSVPTAKARVVIERPSTFLYMGMQVQIEHNGTKVASLNSGGRAVFDISPGANKITAAAWGDLGSWTVPLNAKAGKTYTLVVEPRNENFAVRMATGIVGSAIEAAANENSGAFQLRLKQTGGV